VKRLVRFLIFGSLVSFVLFIAVGASGSGAKSAAAIPAFSVSQLTTPAGANWFQENGNIQSWRYSTLSQINGSNGGGLKLAWTTHLADPATPEAAAIVAAGDNPIVYNGVMYVQDGWMRITAIDAASGKVIWQFDPKLPTNVDGYRARSLGMGDGMVFTGAVGTVYALNAQTGAEVWATQIVDPIGFGRIDVSPVYYKGLVVLGTSGGDGGASAIDVALDAKTGKVKWHYSQIPSNPKAYGWNTWPSKRYYSGGGAVWDPPSINPKLDLVYFTAGQPQPFNGLINGPGAEYGTDGVYALNALTGKFAWWFQEVHHDIWDYDADNTSIVETITHNGKKVDVVDNINKDGYNYVLDAVTGKPVVGVVETPVPQEPLAHTYPTQPIPVGDELVPHVVQDPQDYQGIVAPDGKPYAVSTTAFAPYTDQQYVAIAPPAGGGIEWPEASWDPNTGTEIVCANVASQGFEAPPAADQKPVIRTNGTTGYLGNITQLRSSTPPNALTIARLVAFNPATNKIVWKHDEVSTGGIAAGNATSCASTVTTTASGLALRGQIVATPQYPNGVGMIQAFSVKDGSFLWQVPVLVNGQAIPTIPRIATYAVGGKQYIVSFSHFTTAGPDVSAYTLP
jgi:quinohemoprotein ethanol dehydrogenase